MRTIKISIDRTDLTATQGVDFRVYESSAMGDYTLIQSIPVYDDEEKVFTINERQAIEIRASNKYE